VNLPRDDKTPRTTPTPRDDPFVRYGARMLDPVTSVPRSDGSPPAPTAYRADTLTVSADTRADALAILDRLAETAKAHSPSLALADPNPFEENRDEPDSEHSRRARMLQRAAELELPLAFPVRFALNPAAGPAVVDVWPLLVSYRSSVGDEERRVGLDHLMSSAASIEGSPFMSGTALILGNPFMSGTAVIQGNPFMSGTAAGVYSYLAAGSGGRGPVSVIAQPPRGTDSVFRPHAVVLDTGVDPTHPWLGAASVRVGMQFASPTNPNNPIGMDPNDPDVQRTDPEGAGAVPDPMTGLLASHAGHGTFITGLLRQACPEAVITAIRVMEGDGVVPETALTDALTGVAIVQADAQAAGSQTIDAVVLSLGYYAEVDDASYTAVLRKILLALSRMNVAVFCAAGNDTTMRRFYPAAFSEDPGFQEVDHLPLAAVAALNPDASVALFSNEGPWVNAEAPGVNLISTAPVNPRVRGAWTPDTWLVGPASTRRATVDPDSFGSGFATWSGTSFAAPVLAGRYLAGLVTSKFPLTVQGRRGLLTFRRTRDAKATRDTFAPG